MISITAALSVAFGYGFYRTWLYPYHLDPLSNLPGPSPSRIPFVGNMLQLISGKPVMALYDWAMLYPGSLYRYYWFSRLTLLTSDPITVGYVLGQANDNWLKSKGTEDMFKQNLGDSLLSMTGATHVAHRRYLGTVFKHAYLKSITASFEKVAMDLVQLWKEQLESVASGKSSSSSLPSASSSTSTTAPARTKSTGTWQVDTETWIQDGYRYQYFNLEKYFYSLTLDSIGEFVLGKSFGAIQSPNSTDFESYRIIVESFKVTLLTLLPFSNWIPTPTNRKAWNAVSRFNEIMDKTIADRKKILLLEFESNGGFFDDQDEDAESQKKDMLTLLLVDQISGVGSDDLQIRHDIFTALFAGHETTSATLSWTFYLICQHPKVQVLMRQEVQQMYKRTNNNPTYDDINKQPYLNAVIRESLRLWSPVPLNLRVSVQDDYLPRSNGLEPLFVRAGTNLQLPMFILQRDPRIWGEDSLEFKPERWLDPLQQCPPVMPPKGLCYFPFYHGKRACIGNKVATIEMKVHIARLIQSFEFVPSQEMQANNGQIDWRWSVSLKPEPGVGVGIRAIV